MLGSYIVCSDELVCKKKNILVFNAIIQIFIANSPTLLFLTRARARSILLFHIKIYQRACINYFLLFFSPDKYKSDAYKIVRVFFVEELLSQIVARTCLLFNPRKLLQVYTRL